METYELIRSQRKTLAIQISAQGKVTVRAPRRMPLYEIRAFVEMKRPWIEAHLQRIQARKQEAIIPFAPAELAAMKQAAGPDMTKRVEHYAAILGVNYGKITVRCQKTRWGSCSSKGNLNFNTLLVCCPEGVRDYVAVHELCHLKELNHSPRFWALVESIMSDYKAQKKWLKEQGTALIRRLKET